jgi:hypothetical protein
MTQVEKSSKRLKATGEWFLTGSTVVKESVVGKKKILTARSTYDFKGDLEGKWVGDNQRIEIDLDTGNAKGEELEATFTGTVFGKRGSFHVNDRWTVIDDNIPKSPFRILKGTGKGELAKIQGKGYYWGSAKHEKGKYVAWISFQPKQ